MAMATELLDRTGHTMRPDADETLRRVEFVGLPSPITDPAVQALKTRGKLTGKARDEVYRQESKRQMRGFCRYPGVVRFVDETHGFSRRYEWTSNNGWVAWMTPDDIDRLLNRMHTDPNMRMAHQRAFRVLDDLVGI